jgi:hypothetical protein
VYGLFEGRFGDGSAAAQAAFALYIEKDVRRRQGLVPDIRISGSYTMYQDECRELYSFS